MRVRRSVAARLDELAALAGTSRGQVAREIVERAIDDGG
jgi:hypothetical protein